MHDFVYRARDPVRRAEVLREWLPKEWAASASG
jgi:hypothetical protein